MRKGKEQGLGKGNTGSDLDLSGVSCLSELE